MLLLMLDGDTDILGRRAALPALPGPVLWCSEDGLVGAGGVSPAQ